MLIDLRVTILRWLATRNPRVLGPVMVGVEAVFLLMLWFIAATRPTWGRTTVAPLMWWIGTALTIVVTMVAMFVVHLVMIDERNRRKRKRL